MSSVRLPLTALLATLLATACLMGVFITDGWIAPAVLAALAGAGGCAAARWLSVPRPLVPVVGLGGLALYLVARFAGEQARYGLLPDEDALRRLGELVAEGRLDINRYAAPIEPTAGLLLITCAGVGFVAVAVDTLAVTLRRPALAGLPLLALYTVPAAVVPGGVSWLAFALGAAGYLTLLLVEAHEKVGRWGRALARSGGPARASAGPLAAVGRRVGFAAIATAVVVPIVVPGLSDGVLGTGASGVVSGRGGNRTVAVVNPLLNLKDDLVRPDNRDMLTYTTTDTTPGYIREVGNDDFDGTRWEASRLQVPQSQSVDRGMEMPGGLSDAVQRVPMETRIRVGEVESRWLPVPYPATRVEIEGTWLYDQATFNVFSTQESIRQLDYVAAHLEVTPTAEQLRAAPAAPADVVERFTRLPGGVDRESIRRIATRVTQDAATPYDQALALQSWLREDGGFRYDEQAPDGNGLDAISDFLAAKSGFCVHFASAMAIMARELGIPARIGVGYLPGTPNGDGSYTVRLGDRHAWPELYFENVGWVTFEPTPATRTGAPPSWAQPIESQTSGSDAAAGDPTSEPTPTDAAADTVTSARGAEAAAGIEGRQESADAAAAGAAAAGEEQRPVPWRALALVAVALVVLLAPIVARRVTSWWRWRAAARLGTPVAAAEAAWRELRDVCADFRRRRPESETPRQFADRLGREAALTQPRQDALRRLAGAVERARYAAPGAAPGAPGARGAAGRDAAADAVAALRRDVSSVSAGLADLSTRAGRLRALLLPASTAALLHRAGEATADGLDALDRGWAQLRERLLRRPRVRSST